METLTMKQIKEEAKKQGLSISIEARGTYKYVLRTETGRIPGNYSKSGLAKELGLV